MFQRISFFFLLIACISWITYVSIDIIEKEKTVNYFELFDIDNEVIFSIHYPNEVDWQRESIYSTPENERIIKPMLSSIENGTSIYFSSRRPLIIVSKSSNWEDSQVQKLFKNGIFNLIELGDKKYNYGQFEIIRNGRQLLIHHLKQLKFYNSLKMSLDFKSSYSKIYNVNDTIYTEEIYCNKSFSKKYQKIRVKENKQPLINDKELFSNNIPKDFDTYCFYTKNNLKDKDSLFRNSMLINQVQTGAVLIRKNLKSMMVFDYSENQNPIQNLNEEFNLTESYSDKGVFSLIPFSTLLNNDSQNTYVYQKNGIAIVSNDKKYFDEVMSELSIGSVLSSSKKEMDHIFKDLPRNVSERYVDNELKYAISSTKDISMKTFINRYAKGKDTNENRNKDYLIISPDSKIIAFEAFDEKGNTALLTKNSVIGYVEGQEKWRVELKETPLDMTKHSPTNKLIIELSDSILVLDKYGHKEFTFPITGQQGYKPFGYQNTFGIALYDEENIRLLSKQKGVFLSNRIEEDILQFELIDELNKAYFLSGGYLNEIDLETFETKQMQKVPIGFEIRVANKGYVLIKKTGNTINILDKSGHITGITYPNMKIHDAITAYGQSSILVSSLNRLYLLNSLGQLLWKKTLELNEISKTFHGMNKQNKSVLVLTDEIENKMILLDFSGEIYFKEKLHASKMVKISSFGQSAYSLTTFLNDYLIQYNK